MLSVSLNKTFRSFIISGNRGLTCDVWTGTSLSGTSRAEFDTLPAPSFSKTIDEAFMDSTDFDSVSRMSGFFVAPFDSQYRFYVKGDKKVALYLSTDEDPANLVFHFVFIWSFYHSLSFFFLSIFFLLAI